MLISSTPCSITYDLPLFFICLCLYILQVFSFAKLPYSLVKLLNPELSVMQVSLSSQCCYIHDTWKYFHMYTLWCIKTKGPAKTARQC